MISKIEGPGSIRSTQPVKRAGKTSGTDGASFSKHLDESSESSSMTGVSGANSVSGIFGVQEVDDALAHASKGKRRAQDILDRLEDLRLGLLTGSIPKEKLMQLAQIVNNHRSNITDPKLLSLLDEIDQRAQIELAKYSPV